MVAQDGDLAVLHNRNKMVNAFATTEWVAGSGGAIISRSVTSCAGMTAYISYCLLKPEWGSLVEEGKSFYQLPPQEQAAGPHSCAADLLHHGPAGHAWVGKGLRLSWVA